MNPLADLKELHIVELRKIIETQQSQIATLMDLNKKQNKTIEGYIEVVKDRGQMIDDLTRIANEAIEMAKVRIF